MTWLFKGHRTSPKIIWREKTLKKVTLETLLLWIQGSHGLHVHSPCPPFHCFHSPPGKQPGEAPSKNWIKKIAPKSSKSEKSAHQRSQFQIYLTMKWRQKRKTKNSHQTTPLAAHKLWPQSSFLDTCRFRRCKASRSHSSMRTSQPLLPPAASKWGAGKVPCSTGSHLRNYPEGFDARGTVEVVISGGWQQNPCFIYPPWN